MTPAFLLALVQATLVILLMVDRWVHSVTGKQSLESRVKTLEKKFEEASITFSEKWGEIQTGIGRIENLQGRQEEHLEANDQRINDLTTRVNFFHGTRR